MTPAETIEKTSFINKYPNLRKVYFRCLYRNQNPIHKEDPLNKGGREPEIYAISICQR